MKPYLLVLLLPGILLGQALTKTVPDQGYAAQAMVDKSGQVHVIYCKGDPKQADIHYTKFADDTFSKSIKVNQRPGAAIAIGTVRSPVMTLDSKGGVHVLWLASKNIPKEKEAAPLLYSRLADGSFSKSQNVLGDSGHIDGGLALASDDKNRVFAIWHAGGRNESERKIYFRESKDLGKNWSEEKAIGKPGICACCALNARWEKGKLALLYRNFNPMSKNRNPALLIYDGKDAGIQVLEKTSIKKCPMSSADFGSLELLVWESPKGLQVQKDGKTSTLENTQKAKHPSIAVNPENGDYCITWAMGAMWKRGGRMQYQIFDKSGKAKTPVISGANLKSWSTPTAVWTGKSFMIIQ